MANDKSEDDIKDICNRLWGIMRPNSNSVKKENRVLDAPVNIKSMASNVEEIEEIKSIWVTTRDDQLVCTVFNGFSPNTTALISH